MSPYPGAYANDGTSPTTPRQPASTVGGQFGYLSTTAGNTPQTVRGYVGGRSKSGGDIQVNAVDFTPSVEPAASSALTVSNGFSLSGCQADNSAQKCVIANPKTTSTSFQPAIYFTNDPDTGELKIGLQFSTVAQSSLRTPLVQAADADEKLVAASALSVNTTEVTFAGASTGFDSSDAVDT